ncbi:MAG: zinc transport system ATP-binding protein [Chlamydiota bacterium]|jgi:zinc transport system ATP-binding protein|nr:zinc transport system ATP-binding protein [Chlamydiota bacterium]
MIDIISIHQLFFSYNHQSILEDVNITVQPNEFIVVFGPNGGGKTTFFKLILGLLQPKKGWVKVLNKNPQHTRHLMGYVPQMQQVDRSFPISVLDVVMMGCLSKLNYWGRFPKAMRKLGLEALEKVSLLHKEKASFGSLSGGETQRALIARAIVDHPKILLLDEPTANVDPLAEKSIYQLLKELNTDMTILMVSHDLQTIIDKASRLICVNRQATSLQTKEVCEHFALGLYHTPLTNPQHFSF